MKSLVTLVLILSLLSVKATGQKFDSTYGKPLIIFDDHGTYGLWTAYFVLYEKGQIIYRKAAEDYKSKYYQIVLDQREKDSLISSSQITDDIYKSDSDINVSPGVTDMPEFFLKLNLKGYKKIRVYGLEEQQGRENMPKALLTLYDSFRKLYIDLISRDVKEWIPEKFQVNINRCYADDPQPWPKDFPNLSTAIVRKYTNDSNQYSYRIFIDKDKLPEFEKVYGNEGHMILYGKMMCVDRYFRLPNME